MVEISGTQPFQTTAQSGTTSAPSESARAVVSSDFETFLKMMTVQVQNQDPLNPIDSSDYATQLATFSSVEQQVLTNELLTSMKTLLSGGVEAPGEVLRGYSDWVGMEALVEEPVQFSGQPIDVRADFAPNANSAMLVVRDSEGVELERFVLNENQSHVSWSGRDASGQMHPQGVYSFEVESFFLDELIDTSPAAVYSNINEVWAESGTAKLRLSDGTEMDANNVIGLREPVV
ncbi:flagellar hook capping FlgD N-terminal domain-containing protein [Tropicibacter naphthalenivorans]|uniref:Basal-body rod modification protein FlgD n=1 Tax=Tropicibacter naphthalenivorans TaxID=441103 RepID=A0A0P1GE98_9RHOB|nr:flagellar hook capping FlgD N-terminal domain-containing protein [Tropicibacter naphthalenivorans]CUH79739.1 Basal-body rod modification protein FlgD [Tropicibacter naphthalenivorans]SMC74870.1 flagellar basal-body rod modification protein FlgD [Tropicibacter naphthalenivorans]